MSSDMYTLFDIPTRAPQRCWSMNTWRTRLLLNYKGISYKTEWLEYPDIGPRLEQHVPPNKQAPRYTLPAIQMPDGSYVMDSYKIAEIIEEKHPEPSLPFDEPLQLKFRKILISFMGELTPIYVPGVARNILGDKSLDFFLATRHEDVGMPLYEYGKQNSPGAFDRAEPFAREMTALLNETSSGPYFLGDTVSYTDFVWGGILLFFQCLGQEEYQEVLKRTGDSEAHTKFLDALGLWTERND